MAFELILTETNENILQITLNRPKALNALNRQLAEEIILALRDADKDPTNG